MYVCQFPCMCVTNVVVTGENGEEEKRVRNRKSIFVLQKVLQNGGEKIN